MQVDGGFGWVWEMNPVAVSIARTGVAGNGAVRGSSVPCDHGQTEGSTNALLGLVDRLFYRNYVHRQVVDLQLLIGFPAAIRSGRRRPELHSLVAKQVERTG